MNALKELREVFTKNLRQSGIYVAFVLVFVVFAILTKGVLLSPDNLSNLVLQYSYVLVLAIGMVIVIIAAHIDLSVGSVVALTGSVSAALVIRDGYPWWVGVLAALLVGVLVGVWQGFWVAYVGIPAFVVTLAGMMLFRGLALEVLNNFSLSPFPARYQSVSSGFVNGLLGGNGVDLFTLLIGVFGVAGYGVSAYRSRAARIRYQQTVSSFPVFILQIVLVGLIVMAFMYQLARSRGFPIILIILAVLVIGYTVVMQRSVFGRHIYAIGGNLSAARLSGVNVRRVNFLIFVNMGFLAGLAGVIYSSRSAGAQPSAGTGFELSAIAACFVGGASVSGGIGTVPGAMIGALLIAVMTNGMQLLGIDQSIQQVVTGLVLLLAVAFDIFNRRRASAR